MNQADPKYFFIRALEHTLKNEGGFVDHPKDPGGATNMGITQRTLANWRGVPVSKDDIKNLQLPEVSKIYEAKYWHLLKLHLVNRYPMALVMFDAGVLFGVAGSAFCAQGACGVKQDAIVGPMTLRALNQIDQNEFISKFHAALSHRIMRVVQKNPPSEVFKKGWYNRINKYLEFLTGSNIA